MEQGFNTDSAGNLFKFQLRRNVAGLFKNFLIILEDIDDGIPLDYERQRKKVLDLGNTAIRELESQLELFKIDYK